MNQEELNRKLLESVKTGNLLDVKHCINSGGDINAYYPERKRKLLKYAICYNLNIIIFLIKNGADIFDIGYDNDLFYNIYQNRWSEKKSPFKINDDDFRPYSEVYTKNYDWFNSYIGQKFIIDLHPKSISKFIHYKKLHPQIEKEYQHLITANDFNLL